MTGKCHRLVANIALACLDQTERHILYPRWGGIESGATLSDDFRIMWEPEIAGDAKKQLVHRCYVDSDDIKDHGCVTRALDYSTGSVGFIQSYISGELDDAYTEDEFLENLGMFIGVLSHHVADLCTPVHAGHKMNYARIGFRDAAAFHRKFERDMDRYASSLKIALREPKTVDLTRSHFWGIAEWSYRRMFIRLEDLYRSDDGKGVRDVISTAISAGVRHTADLWHSILQTPGVVDRKWSMQPLL